MKTHYWKNLFYTSGTIAVVVFLQACSKDGFRSVPSLSGTGVSNETMGNADKSGDNSDSSDGAKGSSGSSENPSLATSGKGNENGDPDKVPSLIEEGSLEGGILGGHFDVDTSTQVYALNAGTTNHHVHEFDDKYGVTGVNFFNLLDSQFDTIQKAVVDASKRFVLIVSNAELSTGGILELNGNKRSVLNVQTEFRSLLSSGGAMPVYTLGAPSVPGDIQLKSMSLYFDKDVIEKGGLIPTATGCVRKNNPGAKGEYRNGALVVQAIAKDKFEINPATLTANSNGGLLWETTLFWHRDGNCY